MLLPLGAAHLYGRHLVIDWAENERGGVAEVLLY